MPNIFYEYLKGARASVIERSWFILLNHLNEIQTDWMSKVGFHKETHK